MSNDAESSLATRQSLLGRLKDWEQQTAWREFDQTYGPLVRNVARKAGLNDAEADEVAQDTLIAVAKKIGDFEHAGNKGSFRAWLYRQARWRIADQFRNRARNKAAAQPPLERHDQPKFSTEPDGPRAPNTEVDPEFEELWDAEWEAHIRLAALEKVKRKVTARQYQLFDLHVLQGLPVKEAATAAGTTMAAVYMAKSRIARMVRKEVLRLKSEF